MNLSIVKNRNTVILNEAQGMKNLSIVKNRNTVILNEAQRNEESL